MYGLYHVITKTGSKLVPAKDAAAAEAEVRKKQPGIAILRTIELKSTKTIIKRVEMP